MSLSQDESLFAVISGQNLIMDEQHPKQLWVYKVIKENDLKCFDLVYHHVIKDDP